jgi:hypothetical protein
MVATLNSIAVAIVPRHCDWLDNIWQSACVHWRKGMNHTSFSHAKEYAAPNTAVRCVQWPKARKLKDAMSDDEVFSVALRACR